MGCALIGLWMLGYAVPAAIHNVVEIHFANDNYDDTGGIKSWLVYNCMEIVIGLPGGHPNSSTCGRVKIPHF